MSATIHSHRLEMGARSFKSHLLVFHFRPFCYGQLYISLLRTPRSSQALPPVRQFVSISIVALVSHFTSSLVPSLQAYAVSFLYLPCVPFLLCRCRYSYRCHCHRRCRCRCRCRRTTPREQDLCRWRGHGRCVHLRMSTCSRSLRVCMRSFFVYKLVALPELSLLLPPSLGWASGRRCCCCAQRFAVDEARASCSVDEAVLAALFVRTLRISKALFV